MTRPVFKNVRNLPFHDAIGELRSQTPLPFDHFLEDLRGQSFIIGVDHILRLQTLLRTFGPHCTPSELKSVLCPIFAVSPKQQELFHRAFDRHFNPPPPEKETESAHPSSDENREQSPLVIVSKWRYVLAVVLWIVLSGLIAHLFLKPPEIESLKPIILEHPVTSKPDVPRLPDLEITLPLDSPPLTFYQRYGTALRFAAMMSPLLVFLAVEWHRRNRRTMALQRGRTGKPPFIWPIQLRTPQPEFLKTHRFYTASRCLQRRLEGEVVRLDIGKTLSATVRHAGFPSMRYRPVTYPPEYLILIDLTTQNDHYAGFTDTLSGMLEEEGVCVHRFFYSEDPQVCFGKPGGQRLYLSDMGERFNRCRLILMGSCDALLSPMSGEPELWTEVFQTWRDRAILTPVRPAEWGMREVILARNFLILPASLEGLEALTDHFESPVPPGMRSWVRADVSPRPPAEDNRDLQVIREYLGDESTFQWLCTCAVYPELNWRLTLCLGLSHADRISEHSLLRLIRLPWFRHGSLPDELRLKLIASLNPEKLRAVRQSVYDLLEQTPPPKESAAWDTYQLNLAFHRKILAGDKREKIERRKEMREMAGELGTGRVVRDYTLLRILESEPDSPLTLILPKRLHRVFFENGLPLFGMRTWVRGFLAVAVSLLFFIHIPAPQKPLPVEGARSVAFRFAHIPPGTFMMGSPGSEPGRSDDETLHQVTLTKGFYMQTTEVTQGQWKAVMGDNPSQLKECGDDCPVEKVSWEDAQEFIRKLNHIEGKEPYRLPTEAEWEYAARAGSKTAFANGDITVAEWKCEPLDPNLDAMGWYCGNAGKSTQKVAQKRPNDWGLYDMHGNVWEWCQDWYDSYPAKPVTDPTGPEGGSGRVFRGGSWYGYAVRCRSAYRYFAPPGVRLVNLGLRLARSLP